MRRLTRRAIVAGGLLAAPAAAMQQPVGVQRLPASAPARGGMLDVALWYPALPGGAPVMFGGNAVFAGIAAA